MKYGEEFEQNFWNEIYGCVNYLKLPYETVMNLPIHIRKFWIQKHNKQAEEENMGYTRERTNTYDGESINSFARLDMGKQ